MTSTDTVAAPEKKGWFKRLKDGLKSSSSKLTEGIGGIFTKRKLDQEMLDELEELLVMSDMGIKVAGDLVKKLKKERFNQDISPMEVKAFLAKEIEDMLRPLERSLPLPDESELKVILVVGVNGSGKTTTIAKLGHSFQNKGLSVRLAACDTFRAAAVQQLEVWANRLDLPLTVGSPNSDPAGLAFESLELAIREKRNILMIDTAGRLHNKKDLMDELSKIRRVLKKLDENAPHLCLFVLDATTGQNAYAQLENFKAATPIDGLIITKLDGTAKGGVVVGLSQTFNTPIYGIGVGEGIEDLKPFDANSFASALLGIDAIKN